MKQFIIRYLNNRAEYYSIVIDRCPQAAFTDQLKSATFPFEESDEVLKQIETVEDSVLEEAIPSALLLDDLLKKPTTGQQLAKTVVSIRDILRDSDRIENIGYSLFEILEKQELSLKDLWTDLAKRRQSCLMNVLKLRDDLEFHRLRLP